MRKIASYLRRFFLPVLGIVALLVIQAVCDLSLPDYTSKIVNVGIQQGGIENPAPEQIRQSEMEKLLLLVPEESRDAVLEKYTLNTEKDPAVYEQKRLSGKEQEDLNGILEKPIFLVYMLESGQVEGMPGEITPEILQGMEAQGISLDQVMDELDQKLGEMEGSILTQSDILYVQQEYEALGVDVGAIQIQYIVITGLKMLGLALAAMLATIIVTLLASRTAAGVAKNLRNDVFQKVVSFSNQEFEKFSTASLITRSTNDIQQIQMLLVLLLRIVFYAPIVAVGGCVMALGDFHRFEMTAPLIEAASTGARIRPVYPQTEGLSSRIIERTVAQALQQLEEWLDSDPLPAALRQQQQLCTRRYALENIHFPTDQTALALARRRLVFEELFLLQLGMLQMKGRTRQETAAVMPTDYTAEFEKLLPFTPTGAQQRAIADCVHDMAQGRPMSRLVQGDVGSGKTAVAAGVAYTAIRNGWQVTLMAPTSILAEQHAQSLTALLEPGDVRAQENGIVLKVIHITDRETAQNVPAPVTTYALFRDGKFLTQGIQSDKKFLALAGKGETF